MLARIQAILFYAVLLILCIGVWKIFTLVDDYMAQSKLELEQAKQEISKLETENQHLELANVLLKKDRRLARISNITSEKSEETGAVSTSFVFSELDGWGQPIGIPRTYNIQGDILYVDTLIVKFDDSFVEQGDELKGASLCLFRRLFGENQNPVDGFPIDSISGTPRVYQIDKPLTPEYVQFQQEIWSIFWQLATNPEMAQKKGVRAAQGSAPSQRLIPGQTYKLELRNTGELTFKVEDPAAESVPTTINADAKQ